MIEIDKYKKNRKANDLEFNENKSEEKSKMN